MRFLVPLSIGLMALGSTSTARADDESADALLRRGVELRHEHRNEEALGAFQRALSIAPNPIARAQVALAEQALGNWIEGERDLDKALESADDPWIARNREVLEQALTKIEEHLAWLRVDVDAAEADVRVDGRLLKAGTEERVVAGAAVVDVRASGYLPDSRSIDLQPGRHERIALVLTPVATQAAPREETASVTGPATATADKGPFPRLLGPATLASVGLAGFGVGTFFGLRAIDEKGERNAQCAGGCTPAALTSDADARFSATMSTAAIAGGVVFIGGGLTWGLLDARLGGNRSDRTSAGSAGPIVLGALGVASIGGGIYFGLRAVSAKNALDAECSPEGCSPAAFSTDADARASAAIATAGIAAGLASLAGGALLWLGERSREKGAGLTRRHVAARVVPALGPLAWGLRVEGDLE